MAVFPFKYAGNITSIYSLPLPLSRQLCFCVIDEVQYVFFLSIIMHSMLYINSPSHFCKHLKYLWSSAMIVEHFIFSFPLWWWIFELSSFLRRKWACSIPSCHSNSQGLLRWVERSWNFTYGWELPLLVAWESLVYLVGVNMLVRKWKFLKGACSQKMLYCICIMFA